MSEINPPRKWKFPDSGCWICKCFARKQAATHAVNEGTATDEEVNLVTNTVGRRVTMVDLNGTIDMNNGPAFGELMAAVDVHGAHKKMSTEEDSEEYADNDLQNLPPLQMIDIA